MKENLLNSKTYKEWINSKEVVLIHDTYGDEDSYSAFIVITKFKEKYTITRFFPKTPIGKDVKWNVSVDHDEITAEDVFEKLLTEYSSFL